MMFFVDLFHKMQWKGGDQMLVNSEGVYVCSNLILYGLVDLKDEIDYRKLEMRC